MKSEKELLKTGRYVSYLLRHKENFLDKNGYAPISNVLDIANITQEELDWIVDNNNKKRFEYSDDKTLIRARQGHSQTVYLGLKKIPSERVPFTLYHGTSPDNYNSIRENGLLKMNRQHVHLCHDKETALQVGKRHSKKKNPLLLEIHAKLMSFEGHNIFRSENGVYLTDNVKPVYIKFPE